MIVTLSKYWRIFLLHAQDALQYRLRSLIWMSVGLLSVATLLIFWKANLASNPGAYAANFEEILSYFVLLLLLGNVVVSHCEGAIAQVDIYRGELAKYLLKPISYLWLTYNGELVWRLQSGAWGLLVFGILSLYGLRITITHSWELLILGVCSAIVGHFVSYFLTVCLGLCALWLTSTKGLFELYEMMMLLFAGFMMPLATFEDPLRHIASYSPFAAIVYTPVTILLGNHSVRDAILLVAVQLCWMGLLYLLYTVIWRKGVRVFTGVGQ